MSSHASAHPSSIASSSSSHSSSSSPSASSSSSSSHRPLTNSERLFSASAGAVATSVIVTPLDVIKTRLQIQTPTQTVDCVRTPSQMTSCPQCSTLVVNNGLMDHVEPKAARPSPTCSQLRFTSSADAFSKILRHEGVSALYRGMYPSILMAVPATVLYFNAYDILKERYQFIPGTSLYSAAALAGVSARVLASTMVSPLELLRTSFQSQNAASKSVSSAMASIVRKDGVLSLWRGLVPTLARDVPFSAIYWMNYEIFKDLLEEQRVESTFVSAFLAGAGSGSIAAVLTTPFDVVKTRRQALVSTTIFSPASSNIRSPALGAAPSYANSAAASSDLNLWSLMRTIAQEEGPSALMSGALTRAVRISLACAIMISSYESGKSYFRSRYDDGL